MSKKSKIKFDIISAFPEAFSYLNSSLFKKAQEKKLISIRIHNLRDFVCVSPPASLSLQRGERSVRVNPRRQIDDKPFGGGPGMVLKIEPIHSALQKILNSKFEIQNKSKIRNTKLKKRKVEVILTDAGGKKFDQNLAKKLSKEKQIIIICGHYEGVDERVKKFVDMSISVGTYILTGGELPAMIMVDAISRHLEGFLGNPESLEEYREQTFLGHRGRLAPAASRRSSLGLATPPSAETNLARPTRRALGKFIHSIPVFTRPEIFETKDGKKLKVPKVLLSGNHKKIAEWRKKHSKNINKF